jgi:hypothetical protein
MSPRSLWPHRTRTGQTTEHTFPVGTHAQNYKLKREFGNRQNNEIFIFLPALVL